jgi:hypothetical protein
MPKAVRLHHFESRNRAFGQTPGTQGAGVCHAPCPPGPIWRPHLQRVYRGCSFATTGPRWRHHPCQPNWYTSTRHSACRPSISPTTASPPPADRSPAPGACVAPIGKTCQALGESRVDGKSGYFGHAAFQEQNGARRRHDWPELFSRTPKTCEPIRPAFTRQFRIFGQRRRLRCTGATLYREKLDHGSSTYPHHHAGHGPARRHYTSRQAAARLRAPRPASQAP